MERILNEGKLEGKLNILKGTESNINFENNILSKRFRLIFQALRTFESSVKKTVFFRDYL